LKAWYWRKGVDVHSEQTGIQGGGGTDRTEGLILEGSSSEVDWYLSKDTD
jgi:hypothetical protein